jgi:anti-anti-sigma factor
VQLAEQPITGLVRQPDVHQHERVVKSPESLPGLRAGERHVGFESAASQRAGHRLGQGLFIFDDEESLPPTAGLGSHRSWSVRGTNPGSVDIGFQGDERTLVTLDLESRQTDNGVTVLAPSGRLDVVGAPALREAVSEAMKGGQLRLIIDMEGVSFVDSSGLGSVVAALKQVRSSKGDLRLAAPNQQVRVVLELTTLDRVFPYYATVEEALTDF